MERFATPELLLVAVPVMAAVGWWAVRRRPAVRYSDLRLVAGLPRGRAFGATWGTATLRVLGLLLAIIAAAGPRAPDLRTRLPADGIAIVFVVDLSGSMATTDFAASADGPPISRLEAAKAAFKLFVTGGTGPDGSRFVGRPRDQIGLVGFAAVPRTACPLTHNHSVLLAVLDEQVPKAGVDAGTNIGDAIAEGLHRLEAAGPSRRKVLILLSDGEHNIAIDRPDPPLKPREAGRLAKGLGVPIYAIDCGGDPGLATAPDEVKQRADGRMVLAAIATATNGKAFTADSADDLRAAYREIDALETAPADTFRYRRFHNYTGWVALAALALLALGVVLDRTWWRTFPG